ncbi:MAG TPA: methyltransferase [Labilithrix sp.]|nr:methyltransferase [Labilithrix sp.]
MGFDAPRDARRGALSSRVKLTPRAAGHYQGETLFDRLGRAVCEADCLPRKELYESWELARRARRRFRGGRIVDLACGHGLVAHLMLLLDDTSPTAIAVDTRLPPSAAKVAALMTREWPRLAGRITLETRAIGDVAIEAGDLVVSAHACGALTDDVLTSAIAARARVVVLPCCHEKATCDTGGMGGWMDAALAIDVTRAARLRAAGYTVHTQRIPETITPKNRLLLAEPAP